jgi:hypothetical protein
MGAVHLFEQGSQAAQVSARREPTSAISIDSITQLLCNKSLYPCNTSALALKTRERIAAPSFDSFFSIKNESYVN